MIVVKLPLRFRLNVTHFWLSSQPSLAHALGFSVHYDCLANDRRIGFIRVPKQALFVDLREGAEKVLETMGQDSRYAVRRGAREGAVVEIESDPEAFAHMYNAFAKTKNFAPMDAKKLRLYWPKMVVTKCVVNGEALGMHSYFLDPSSQRMTLLWAASLFRTASTSAERNAYGRANLYHYWADMQMAEQRGVHHYDFGYFGDTTQGLDTVNQFKQRFPCSLQPVSTYYSLPWWLWKRLLNRHETL